MKDTTQEAANKVTCAYARNGLMLREELDKYILTHRGFWLTVLFKFREYHEATKRFGKPRTMISRYKLRRQPTGEDLFVLHNRMALHPKSCMEMMAKWLCDLNDDELRYVLQLTDRFQELKLGAEPFTPRLLKVLTSSAMQEPYIRKWPRNPVPDDDGLDRDTPVYVSGMQRSPDEEGTRDGEVEDDVRLETFDKGGTDFTDPRVPKSKKDPRKRTKIDISEMLTEAGD